MRVSSSAVLGCALLFIAPTLAYLPTNVRASKVSWVRVDAETKLIIMMVRLGVTREEAFFAAVACLPTMPPGATFYRRSAD